MPDIQTGLFSPLNKGGISSGKAVSHERKSVMTPTPRDNVPAKSPVSDPVASHSPFDPHLRPMVPGEVYHLPPHLDPAMAFQRVLDPGTIATTPPPERPIS